DGHVLTGLHLDEAYATRHVEVKPGQYVAICVTDTGCGMDADTLTRAFEPFFTTKPEGKGTGLGLSQVYGFVKQSNGHIKLYSEVDCGTTVRIYLPRFHSAAGNHEPEVETYVPEADGETILVVEDDPEVRAYTVGALRELGYIVIEAGDGPSALGVLRVTTVDLLFTDVVLPGGMTGEDLALRAREMSSTMKILFTTGYARNAIVHQGRLDHGVQLITKPFTFDDLATKIREVLDQ
ncbi:MAG: response regulator, partial [Myxococcales bacterium]